MPKRLTAFLLTLAMPVVLPARTVIAQGRLQAGNSAARKAKSAGTSKSDDAVLQRERLNFEKQKFVWDAEIENKKLEIEREKLEIEKSASKWSVVAAVAPWVGAFLTLCYGIWSLRETAKLQFETKAAEIAFSGKTARAVANRVKALKAIFPERLPDNLTRDFDPINYGGDKQPSEEMKFFLELLLKDPDHKALVFDLWMKLFPGDEEWLKRVEAFCKPQAIGQQD